VRESTREVVAAYAKNGRSRGKLGTFSWISEEALGEEAGLLFLISVIAVVERNRRDNQYETNA
jgi:hypothetical protein